MCGERRICGWGDGKDAWVGEGCVGCVGGWGMCGYGMCGMCGWGCVGGGCVGCVGGGCVGCVGGGCVGGFVVPFVRWVRKINIWQTDVGVVKTSLNRVLVK